jgi:hypothetical protein
MKKIFLIATVALLGLSSCDKDDDDCEQNMAGVSGTYKLTAMKYRPSGSTNEIDLYAFLEACEKDDLTVLNANGTYAYQDAGTVCDPNGSFNGTWTMSGSSITVDGESGTIQSFDCDNIVFYTEDSGDRITFTYVRQ